MGTPTMNKAALLNLGVGLHVFIVLNIRKISVQVLSKAQGTAPLAVADAELNKVK